VSAAVTITPLSVIKEGWILSAAICERARARWNNAEPVRYWSSRPNDLPVKQYFGDSRGSRAGRTFIALGHKCPHRFSMGGDCCNGQAEQQDAEGQENRREESNQQTAEEWPHSSDSPPSTFGSQPSAIARMTASVRLSAPNLSKIFAK